MGWIAIFLDTFKSPWSLIRVNIFRGVGLKPSKQSNLLMSSEAQNCSSPLDAEPLGSRAGQHP